MPDKDGLKMATAVTRPAIARPLPNSASKTYVTCAPVLSHSSTNGMKTNRQQIRKAHSLPGGPLNLAANKTPPFARHTRPAGTTTPCQDSPLDLTKPLDLSVKNKPTPQNRERTKSYGLTKCYRETHLGSLSQKGGPAVVTPFNFTNLNKTVPLVRTHEHNCSRRTGLMASSPRNYNHKGRAMVAPRREHAPEILHAKQQLLDPPRENSALLKHSHIPVHSQSVPYSHVTHSLSQANSFPVTTSSSGHMLLPPYQPVSTNSLHAMHHELRHKPILPKPSAVARPIASAASITSSISEGQVPPARIAHVSAFSHTSTTFAHTLTPTAQSHSSSSFGLPGQLNARMQHSNQPVGFHAPCSTSNMSNVNRYTSSISNGALSVQKKRMRRSHSVSPMRPSRSTYKKESDRHNIRVLKMLESSIAAGAKIHKLLKPIDGPEASQLLSGDTRTFKEDSNNNHTHGMVTYSQPLRVDIPEQHSPNVPPSLPNAFSNDRMLTLADHIESVAYSACKMHQLSPPTNTLPNDRISPTMPVLVPHSMYSPGELPAVTTHDSNLPVLKNAKLEGSTHPSPSVFNPLTLPFLTTVADSRKVQTVPPIISEPRKREEPRSAPRHSQHSLHRDTTLVSRISAHEEIPGMNHRARQELDRLLMQLDRKTAAAVAIQRKNMANAQGSHSAVTTTRPYVANTSNSTIPYPKPSLHVSHHAEQRTVEEDREIFRKMLMQKRDLRKQALEMRAKQHFGSIHKQEPEVVDLTSSPPRSPADKKQDVHVVHQERTRYSNIASLQKPNQKFEQPPGQGQIKTANSVGRYPHLGVAGKSLTVKEAIEAAYGLPISEAQTKTKRNGEVETDKETNSPTETDYARPISLVVNTKLLNDSKEHQEENKTADSYCKRHRQLLFSNTQKVTVTQSVPDLPRKPQTTTLSQVITDHFVTHDPRKKHLATLNTRRKSPSTSPLVPSKESPPVNVQSVTEAASPPQAPSPQLPNGENVDQGRRRKLTLEINRIANTASYVGDLPKKPRTGDLLVDSSLLDREERALQFDTGGKSQSNQEQRLEEPQPLNLSTPKRAMLRFSEMEQQERLSTNNINNNNNNVAVQQDTVQKISSEQKKLRAARGRPPRGRGRGLSRATKVMKLGRKGKFPWRLARPQMPRRESPRKHALKILNPVRDTEAPDGYQNDGTKRMQKSQKFDDFKPEILEARTRNAGTRRNSVRRRTPYHKNARYELEIEKEEAKLVERKRKRTVSYGSNSGADTTDESSNTVSPQQIKRRRGRPRKNDSQRVLVAATGRRIKIKYKGVGRGRYPRVKKILPRRASRSNTVTGVSTNEAIMKNGYCSGDNSANSSPFSKGGLQRPLQVVMDPDNHTKMKFVSVPRPTQLKKAAAAAIMNNKPSGKRKRKMKHLGPVSPCPIENTEDIDDVYTFKQENEDDNDPKKVELTTKVKENVCPVQIKQEPEDKGYEPEPVLNQPPPVQIVRPDPPPDFKKLICNKKLGETVLHRACRMARDMCDINAKDNAGYTPLHECCVNGRLEVAEHLLRHGADVNASAADGTRPLHDAVDNHRIEIVRLLLAFGADPLVATYSGRTALKLARTKQMRTFIVGYLRDVNGQWEVDEEEYPNYKDDVKDTQWRFRSSCSFLESKAENQPIVKDDIPDDDATDVMFELSDTPHLPTFNLELARDNGPRNWLVLSDVKKALGGKFDDVVNTCEDIQPISITRREFNYALKEGLTSLTGDDLPPKEHGHVSDSDIVELVELNNSIRRALGIDTEFVR